MSMNESLNLRKAVIALNNAGVLLIRRNRFRESIETFNGALRLMNKALDDVTVDVLPALQNSSNRTSLPPLCKTNIEIFDLAQLLVVSSEMDPLQVLEALEYRDSRICISIDITTELEFEEFDDSEMACKIVLYNYSVAHQLLASKTKERKLQAKLYSSGIEILRLINSLFSNETSLSLEENPTNLLVQLLVTRSIIMSLRSSEYKNEVINCLQTFLEITQSIESQLDLFQLMGPRAAAAA
jgi:hypothetical protein